MITFNLDTKLQGMVLSDLQTLFCIVLVLNKIAQRTVRIIKSSDEGAIELGWHPKEHCLWVSCLVLLLSLPVPDTPGHDWRWLVKWCHPFNQWKENRCPWRWHIDHHVPPGFWVWIFFILWSSWGPSSPSPHIPGGPCASIIPPVSIHAHYLKSWRHAPMMVNYA